MDRIGRRLPRLQLGIYKCARCGAQRFEPGAVIVFLHKGKDLVEHRVDVPHEPCVGLTVAVYLVRIDVDPYDLYRRWNGGP